jgi:hypothetical protein
VILESIKRSAPERKILAGSTMPAGVLWRTWVR